MLFDAGRHEPLVLHETVPGHHTQNARAQELTGVPSFRRYTWTPAFGNAVEHLRSAGEMDFDVNSFHETSEFAQDFRADKG